MLKKQIMLSCVLASFSLSVHHAGFAQQSNAPGLQKRLSDLLSSAKDDELIAPERAFRLHVAVKGTTALVADLIPANGYYLYRDRIKFSLKNSSGVAIKTVALPLGKVTQDATFGKTETYEHPIQAAITLERSSKVKNITLVASFQGCHKKTGVCYPPMETTLNLVLP